MINRKFTTEAIIISRKNYSEADRILKVFSKDRGKIVLMAKGIRKPKSRKRGALEVFSYVKLAAYAGKNMSLVTEVEMLDSFNEIRRDLKKVSLAYYFLEVVDKLTQENEHNSQLFELLLASLKELYVTKSLKKLKKDYVFEVLTNLGFWPRTKKMENPDEFLEYITERKMSTPRVGKKLLS